MTQFQDLLAEDLLAVSGTSSDCNVYGIRAGLVGDNLAVLVSHISSGKLTTPGEAALACSPHPPSLLRLVGPTMLLHTDPEKRLTLKALIEVLATVDDVP